MNFKKVSAKDYQIKTSPQDERIVGKLVSSAEQADYVLLGYPDDDGIKLNGGRPGAALAPGEIRKAFFKMTSSQLPPSFIYDEGDVDLELELGKRHEEAQKTAEKYYSQGKFLLSLGGGHDYGFPDTQAFLNTFKNSKLKPVIINFDAHLDVRPLDQGLTSGTPFYRMLTANPKICHFFEVGIQDQCNSKSHLEWCKNQGGKIIPLSDIEKKGMLSIFKTIFKKFKKNPCFISVDIDSFSSAFAPGCSQSWPTGLTPQDFFEAFDFLFQQLDIKGMGIYEVSPPLDVQPLTSRLAALILYRCLKNRKSKGAKREKSKRIRQR
jgi:formiminoglutamase